MARLKWDYDCIVVGAGPGGLTTALYLGRFRRSVAIIDGGRPRAAWIPRTHNLIGFHGGISGPGLLRRLQKQVHELGVPRFRGKAGVHRLSAGFCVEVDGREMTSRRVVLATGIEDRQPEIPNLEELRRSGLLRYCPVCDGFEHRGKDLFLFIRTGDCFARARFLRQYTRHLLVVAPKNFSLSSRRATDLRKLGIAFVRGELAGLEILRGKLRLQLSSGQSFRAHAGYVELGFHVRDEAFRHLRGLRRNKQGQLLTDSEQRVVPGLFAVGDCVAGLAQIAVAAGQAAVAATAIHNELLAKWK